MTRKNAKIECESKGGYLAVIDTKTEYDEVMAMGMKGPHWIGMSKTDTGAVWDDGTEIDFLPNDKVTPN